MCTGTWTLLAHPTPPHPQTVLCVQMNPIRVHRWTRNVCTDELGLCVQMTLIWMRRWPSIPPHEGSNFDTPYEQYIGWGNNINFIFMRDQNSPSPINNMLVGIITSTLSPWGIKFATPYEQYIDWGNNINFIFMRDQNSPPLMNNMLIGAAITSTLSSYGINICHPLWAICWLG